MSELSLVPVSRRNILVLMDAVFLAAVSQGTLNTEQACLNSLTAMDKAGRLSPAHCVRLCVCVCVCVFVCDYWEW